MPLLSEEARSQLRYALEVGRYRLSCLPYGGPSLTRPVSQLVTQRQIESDTFARWCSLLREEHKLHRKLWEYVYVLQVLESKGLLHPGSSGLGFGVGKEPLAAVMAARGCTVLATDYDPESASREGWASSGMWAGSLQGLNERGICPPEQFRALVTYRTVDMRAIDADLRMGSFDFIWSACALEHLGNLEEGLRFVQASLECLKPGGIAIHTTEYNISSNEETIATGPLVVYRRRDIEQLCRELRAQGHEIAFNPHPGCRRADFYCDLPPYKQKTHLKLVLGPFIFTSVGLAIRKAGG